MKRRKVLALGLSLALALSVLPVGVSAADQEEVDLTLVYPVASTFNDQDAVSQALSDLAKEELNVNLTVKALPILDCYTQLQLMIAGGEDIDVFPTWPTTVGTFVSGGYVLDLTEYMSEEQLPNIYQWVGEEDLKTANLGGYLWGVPRMAERVNPHCIEMRTDILNELGYKEEDIQSFDDLTEVFAAVHEAYPDMTVYGGSYNEGLGNYINVTAISDPLNDKFGTLDNYGETLTVANEYESEYWISLIKTVRGWYEAGYVSKDMSTSQDSGAVLMAAGNLFAYGDNYKPNTKQEKLSQTGYELSQFVYTDPLLTTSNTAGLCYSVSGVSKNPDRAVQLLDWLFGSAKANDLMNWGIEGTNWVENEDGTASFPEGQDASSSGYHNDYGWALPNQFAGHLWEGNDPDLYEQYVAFAASGHKSAAYGFSFDSTNVEDEVIACSAVLDEYLPSITTGSVDPDTAIAEMNEKLYAAGLQTIMDEKQAQLNAWAAENQ